MMRDAVARTVSDGITVIIIYYSRILTVAVFSLVDLLLTHRLVGCRVEPYQSSPQRQIADRKHVLQIPAPENDHI